VLGLFAKRAAFLVTPKTSERVRWWEALRANWAESTLALLGLLGIGAALTRPTELAGPLLAGLLVFPTAGMAAAPVNSWAAQRAALPADLREWRTTEWKRSRNRTALVRTAAAGGVAAVVGVVAAAVGLMLAPGAGPVRSPQLAPAPAHSTGTRHHQPGPSPSSATPSVSPSSTSPPSPSPSPSASSPTPAPTSPAPSSPAPAPSSSGP
jgi:hypothetical protein